MLRTAPETMAPRPSGVLISAVLVSAMLLDGFVGAHASDDGREPPAPVYTPRQLAACRGDRVLGSWCLSYCMHNIVVIGWPMLQ